MTRKFRVLLVDDDFDDRYFFEMALKELSMPIQFSSVSDGEKLMHLLSNLGRTLPDVIFLDLNMPRKRGYECLEEIVSSPEVWPFEIRVKTLILNNHKHEKNTIHRVTDCDDSQTAGRRHIS